KPLDVLLVFPQMATPEAEPVDRIDNRLQDGNERPSQPLQSLVEGVVEQVVVDIPREVDEALLLGTLDRVIRRVEIGDEDAPEPVEHLLEDRTLARGRVDIDNLFQVREGPDVSTVLLERDLALVGVNQGPASEFLLQPLVRNRMPLRQS